MILLAHLLRHLANALRIVGEAAFVAARWCLRGATKLANAADRWAEQ